MESIIPWSHCGALIESCYYKNTRGRKPKDIEVMLHMYLIQTWFSLSDEGIEETIYDSYATHSFRGINFSEEKVSDSTTLCHFRKILKANYIGQKISGSTSARAATKRRKHTKESTGVNKSRSKNLPHVARRSTSF